MVTLAALRGALGFLTRLPVGAEDEAWEAFRETPAAFPLAGYVVGGVVVLPVAAAVAIAAPPATTALVTLALLVVLTGVTHLDGVADLGDAAVVHGDAADRVAVLKDLQVGVGAAVAVALSLLGLLTGVAALGALARGPPVAGASGSTVAIAASAVLAAEVGAKAAMACVVCLGEARHEGLGSQFTGRADESDLTAVGVAVLPAVALAPPVGLAAVAGALAGGGLLAGWASRLLGGVNGDVLGATNDAARAVGLHAAALAWAIIGTGEVVAWTPF